MKRSNWTNGLELLAKTDSAEVYGGTTVGGSPHAIGFSGRRQNPDFKYSFKSVEARDEFIKSFLDGTAKAKRERDAYLAEKKAASSKAADEIAETLNPGAILATNWGYEQTNVDFWQVIERHGKRITLRRLHQTTTEDGPLAMSGKTKPIPNSFDERHDPVTIVVRGKYL